MPQLLLHIDENTLHKIMTAAKAEKLSLSEFVVKKLNESMNNSWLGSFESLFGALSDSSFAEVARLNYADDVARENF